MEMYNMDVQLAEWTTFNEWLLQNLIGCGCFEHLISGLS